MPQDWLHLGQVRVGGLVESRYVRVCGRVCDVYVIMCACVCGHAYICAKVYVCVCVCTILYSWSF